MWPVISGWSHTPISASAFVSSSYFLCPLLFFALFFCLNVPSGWSLNANLCLHLVSKSLVSLSFFMCSFVSMLFLAGLLTILYLRLIPLSLVSLSFFLFCFVSTPSLTCLVITSTSPFFLSPTGDDQHDSGRRPWHGVGVAQGSLP